jgi:predicted RNase H-like nuclease
MPWLCGVDGFRHRWLAVLWHAETGRYRHRIVARFADLLSQPEQPLVIAIDIPIGLPRVAGAGGRACDRLARRSIGGVRAGSVFPLPGRIVLSTADRAAADRLHRAAGGIGVGAHTWGLIRKLREVHAVMTPALQHTIYEVHPELSFQAMAEGPLTHGKKTAAGKQERMQRLTTVGFPAEYVSDPPPELPHDDFLDACAALWTARRIASGTARRLPAQPVRDPDGLEMAIWY